MKSRVVLGPVGAAGKRKRRRYRRTLTKHSGEMVHCLRRRGQHGVMQPRARLACRTVGCLPLARFAMHLHPNAAYCTTLMDRPTAAALRNISRSLASSRIRRFRNHGTTRSRCVPLLARQSQATDLAMCVLTAAVQWLPPWKCHTSQHRHPYRRRQHGHRPFAAMLAGATLPSLKAAAHDRATNIPTCRPYP